MTVIRKTPEELMIMREAGRINALALQAMREAIRPGISTKELDDIAANVLRKHGATAAFLGYAPGKLPPFPGTITASINNEIVHGIPTTDRVLQEGDIVSLDCGTIYQGYVGDSAFTIGVGTISAEAQKLIDVTEQAFYKGLEVARAGNYTHEISQTIQKFVESHGYGVVRDYTGHGVGRTMHEEPQVPNWWPTNRHHQRFFRSVKLEAGITFALEPMVTQGKPDTLTLADQWTVVTKDGTLCSHFEHTIAIMPEGPPMLLTVP